MQSIVPMLFMTLTGMVVLAYPSLYEKNSVTLFLLGCAWVLQEVQSFQVIHSLTLALLQGQACHLTLSNLNIASSNVMWISFFILIHEQSFEIARLVVAIVTVTFSFREIYKMTIAEAIRTRRNEDYWNVDEDRSHASRLNIRPARARRRELGTLFQLVITRRAYDMLSRRSREDGELMEAKRLFLMADSGDVEARDRFTMAVFSAISRQGTATMIRSAESSQVRRVATRIAAFVERKFTSTALQRMETVFRPLPVLDPAEQDAWVSMVMLMSILVAHKKLFQYIKRTFNHGKTPLHMFLVKQLTRGMLVIYLGARFCLGSLKLADPITPSVGLPPASALNASLLQSPQPIQAPIPTLRLTDTSSPTPFQNRRSANDTSNGLQNV